ncbi:hypothetical protein [Bradyrhizobium agreste]|uniref:hypothetical protein n=1 Tax=Bradyrhizobium agreste TaxID=2751811 RepID=UPI001FE5BF2E|nr:hypothetical protein [Bradyrhizobium agreste]
MTALMTQAFARPVEPTLSLPLMVDVWYYAATLAALGKRDRWGEVQGITVSPASALAKIAGIAFTIYLAERSAVP